MKADANMKEGQMAGHMRDTKGQFKKGYHGLKPVGGASGKKKKLEGQLKDRRVTTKTDFDANVTTRTRDITPAGTIKKPAVVTKPAGTLKKGDTVAPGTKLKLSKNQKARVAQRQTDLKAGREAKLVKAKPASMERAKAEIEDILTRAHSRKPFVPKNKLTPAEKKEQLERAKKFNADAEKKEKAEAAARKAKNPMPVRTPAQKAKHRLETAEDNELYAYDDHGAGSPEHMRAKAALEKAKAEYNAELAKEKATPDTKAKVTTPGGTKVVTPKAAAPKVVSPKAKGGSKAEIAKLEKERKRLGEDMNEIKFDYDGDSGYMEDDAYRDLQMKQNAIDAKLRKMVPGGKDQFGMFY